MIEDCGPAPLRVFLVEDNEHDRRALERAIRAGNPAATISHSPRAEEALERLSVESDDYDIIVADYGLPGFSGIDLCRELIKCPVLLPVVIVTGAGSENVAVEALKAGAYDYLIKDSDHGYLKLLPLVLADVVRRHQDQEARKRAEERIKVALAEKEVLLKEIHHRVKNNLQVVSSMLSLKASTESSAETRDALADIQIRVRAMASLHESLQYSEDMTSINTEEFLTSLVSDMKQSAGADAGRLSFQLDASRIFLDVDRAISFGQIISELLSNSLKHAFPDGRPGNLEISVRQVDDGNIELVVSDDGVGLAPDFDWRNSDSLGLQLVNGLTARLRGKIDIDGSGGTRITITFREDGA